MRLILRQMALTVTSLLALYLAALGLSFAIYPPTTSSGGLDVWSAEDSLYMTMPRYGFLNLARFKERGRKAIILGASNAGVVFRQQELQPALTCANVYNYGIGGANISQLGETADLILGMQDALNRKDDLFVLAVWYGMFGDSAAHWHIDFRQPGDTDLDLELYRYGFFRRGPEGPRANVSPAWFEWAVVAVRPYLAIEHMLRDLTANVRARFLVRRRLMTDEEREAGMVTDAQKPAMLQYWTDSMGSPSQISPQQSKIFSDTIAKLLRNGSRVVVLDLPIPHWHAAASPYAPSYRDMIAMVRARFESDPLFTFLEMPDLDKDADFSDEVHPKPHLAAVWRQRLMSTIKPLLCPATQATQPPLQDATSAQTALHP